MALPTRWDPFGELEDLQQRLSNLFGRAPVRREGEGREALTRAQWAPLVDIVEDEKEYLIKVEAPEVRKEDLKLSVEHGVLTITGERKFEKEEKGKRYHRVERAYGHFSRSFTLPEDADTGRVSAQYQDGVLNVHVAKSEKAKPRSIDITVK